MNSYTITAITKQREIIKFTMLATCQREAHLAAFDQLPLDASILIEGRPKCARASTARS